MPEWVVLLEAVSDAASDPIDARDVRRLQEALDGGPYGTVLHSAERYALQVTATGASPIEALFEVVARWSDAVRELGLAAWKLVRTEVFTPADLHRELERAQHEEIGTEQSAPDCPADDAGEVGHELLRRAFSDGLTGLLGQEAFAHRLAVALAGGRRPAVALLDVDIDGVERGDEVVGEATEDDVLVALARRLAASHRPEDALARLAGHEYGVLLEDSTEDVAFGVARRMLDAAHRPLASAGRELPSVSACAGVASSQPGEAPEQVMAKARAALGAARAAGGDDPVVWGSDVPHPAPPRRDLPVAVLQDPLAHVQLLQQAASAAHESDSLHGAAQVVMHHICHQVGSAVGHLWVSRSAAADDEPETYLWHLAGAEQSAGLQEAVEDLLARPAIGLRDRVLATGRPEWISDLAHGDDVLARRHGPEHGLESAFAFPVLVGSEVVAVLSFLSCTPIVLTASFVDVLTGIGTQLGRVVERQRAAEALRRAAEQLRSTEATLREAAARTRSNRWSSDVANGGSGRSPEMPDISKLHPGQRGAVSGVLGLWRSLSSTALSPSPRRGRGKGTPGA